MASDLIQCLTFAELPFGNGCLYRLALMPDDKGSILVYQDFVKRLSSGSISYWRVLHDQSQGSGINGKKGMECF